MALDSQRNIAVTASAGSGKTATLVERYIELLRLHPEIGVRQVLAITFTQKAAAEMRQRLARRLAEALDQELPEQEKLRLREVYEDLSAARISTIHAFCTSVLREYPIEADVDPAFAVLEEVDAALLRRQALRQTLEELAQTDDGDPDKEALRRTLGEWPRRYLDGVLDDLLRKKRLARHWCRRYAAQTPTEILDDWRRTQQQACEPACRALLADRNFAAMLVELADLEPLSAEPDSASKRLTPIRESMRALGKDPTLDKALATIPQLITALLTAKGEALSARSLGKKSNWDEAVLARLRELVPTLGQCLAPHAEILGLELNATDERAAEVLVALARLFLRVDARYARSKGEGGRLELDDLLERCHQLIAGDEAIRQRLARHYRFVLVDEFQDTDPLQWDIIRPLVSTDGQIAADKLFIVGDPKQSIYSFREADVTVFARVRAAIASANKTHARDALPFGDDDDQVIESAATERLGFLVMGENFRTLAQPVAFVNALFSQFMKTVPGEPFQVGYDPLVGRRPIDVSAGSVELLLLPPDEDQDDLEMVQREAELVARRLAHLFSGDDLQIADTLGLRPPRPGDIALLLRRRRNLFAYEYALRAHGIPFQVVGGRGFYQRQEIYDLANVLRTLHNPRDAVALLGALRSPYFGLSDNALYTLTAPHGESLWDHLHDGSSRERLAPADRAAADDAIALLKHWESLRDRVPLVELLHAILEDTGAWGFLSFGERGGQNAANIHKLLELARESGGAVADFVTRLDLLTSAEDKEGEAVLDSDADAVQILTVHASKGLEYPIVVVADLDGDFNLRNSDAALVDADNGIGLRVLDPQDSFHPTASFIRRLATHNERRRRLAEEKRLFYVACTRARDHLLLAGSLNATHFADHYLDAAPDCLFWICRSLGISEIDLERGSKTVAGLNFPLRIYTTPDAFPTTIHHNNSTTPAYRRLLQEPTTIGISTESDLRFLSPVADPHYRPEFAVSELALFATDPEAHHRQYLLGLPPWPLHEVDAPRRRALLFGELAHAGLEALSNRPVADPAILADNIMAATVLPVATWHDPFKRELTTLIHRCQQSPLASPWLTDPGARTEEHFTLALDHGLVHGTVDYMGRGADGLWQLVDYKTGHISDQAEAIKRYRLQLQIYALCLETHFPGQDQYRAILYFADLDDSHHFKFTAVDLLATRDRIDDLVAQLILTKARP